MVNRAQPNMAGVIAAVGNFDGVHLGHQYLLKETAVFARDNAAAPGVVLFDPHPRRYFRPDEPPFLLTLPAQRDVLLRGLGVEAICALRFDQALAGMAPEAFITDVLKGRLGLAGVVIGADFRFGKGRAGDGEMLRDVGAACGLKVKLVGLKSGGSTTEKLGSSAVRGALREGAVEKAAAILGRPWSVFGEVFKGSQVGRTIGFPTANMTLGALLAPRQGVYATRVAYDGKVYDGVSNFGRRPTVGGGAPLLESYLFDFDGDLYGREVEVTFVAFLREEQKFDGLDALKAQIAEDCRQAQAILR